MKVPKELRNLIAVLIDNNRIGQVAKWPRHGDDAARAVGSIKPAEIVIARELGERRAPIACGRGRQSWPEERLTRVFKLDPTILGGTVVRIGSTVYDGSVRGRLDRRGSIGK